MTAVVEEERRVSRRRLSAIVEGDFKAYEGPELLSKEEDDNRNSKPVELAFYNQRFIEFNDSQQHVFRSTLPLLVSGAAGSGKSCVALSLLANKVEEYIYSLGGKN